MATKTRRMRVIHSLDELKDDVASDLYGITERDGELPALELWLREQSRLVAEMEVQQQDTIDEMTSDPLDILIAREEAREYDNYVGN